MQAIWRWLTDAPLAESIAGDLAEQRRRRAERSRLFAALWYWRRSFAIVVFFAFSKLRVALRRLTTNGPGVGRRGEFGQTLRSLRRTPWYSLTVIGVIALSMSLTTTVFAIVDGVLFKPLPYRASHELFTIRGSYHRRPAQRSSVSAKDLREWSAAAPEVQIAAFGHEGTIPRLGDLNTRALRTVEVSERFLDVIGVPPLVGGFTPSDYASAVSVRPALITFSMWQQYLGGRPDVVGQDLIGGDHAPVARIAGVLPPDFVFPTSRLQPDLMWPLSFGPGDAERRDRRFMSLIGRVPRALFSQAQAKLDAAAARSRNDWPANSRLTYGAFDHVGFTPIGETLTGRARPTFLLLFASSAVLAMLGCLNLAGLAAARAEDRIREAALRRALGAGTAALTRQHFGEAAILALIGSAIGVVLAPSLLAAISRLLPADVSLLKEPSVDLRLLGFAVMATFAVSVLVSLRPMIAASRAAIAPMIGQDSLRTTRGRRFSRRMLVASQVAVGFVLTLGGALVVGSLVAVWQNEPGYAANETLIVEMSGRGTDAQVGAAKIANVVQTVPGVTGVTWIDGAFLAQTYRMDLSWKRPVGADENCLSGPKMGVRSGFFELLGISRVAGRWPTTEEIESTQPVAVVSQVMGQWCWPGRQPVGQTFLLGDHVFTVVGVSAAARLQSIDEDNNGEIYVPAGVFRSSGYTTIAARVSGSADRAVPNVISTLRASGTMATVSRVTSVSDALADTVKARRLSAWLFGAFAVGALVILGVGVLGLVAMTVAKRTREIGIRFALGATRDRVIGLLLREQLAAVVIGLAAGAAISIWASKFVRAYLYGMTPSDSRVWIIATLAILAVAIGGTLIPSLRASRANPVQALRAE